MKEVIFAAVVWLLVAVQLYSVEVIGPLLLCYWLGLTFVGWMCCR